MAESEHPSQRIDKWLWVARLFKTRSVAAQAVTGGRVHVDGQRAKPAKLVSPGARIEVTRGESTIELIVRGLAAQRRPAPEAQALYEETRESIARGEAERARREAAAERRALRAGRPSKRDRRRIADLKERGLRGE